MKIVAFQDFEVLGGKDRGILGSCEEWISRLWESKRGGERVERVEYIFMGGMYWEGCQKSSVV